MYAHLERTSSTINVVYNQHTLFIGDTANAVRKLHRPYQHQQIMSFFKIQMFTIDNTYEQKQICCISFPSRPLTEFAPKNVPREHDVRESIDLLKLLCETSYKNYTSQSKILLAFN